MEPLEKAVRAAVEDLHVVFVDWFTGKAARDGLDRLFAPLLDPRIRIVSPDGTSFGRDDFLAKLRPAYGRNPDLRIAVRDVRLLHDLGETLLISYSEWQAGARETERRENARLTTALLTKSAPFYWLHVHETWLPQTVQVERGFDF